jgi:TatD DNase family protein
MSRAAAYINIHTHSYTPDSAGIEVVSLYEQYERLQEVRYCSLGIHPWYAGQQPTAEQDLLKWANGSSVLAIGECGLDNLMPVPMEVQEHYFRMQIRLANELNKPLVIHCVHAYTEVLAILKEERAQVPVLFHGFNRMATIAAPLLKAGYYLSFGRALLSANEALKLTLRQTPADKFFLETDDWEGDIAEIYQAAAQLRNTTVAELTEQLEQNFNNTFKLS